MQALQPELPVSGLETKVVLIDPQVHTRGRSVFRIPPGDKILAKRIRVCNYGFSNVTSDLLYFGHAGVYSILSRVSFQSVDGVEVDRIDDIGILSKIGLGLLKMPNSSEFSVNRQLSQNMCCSVFVNSYNQVTLTETATRDDASLMGDSIYLDISFLLDYLKTRSIISEGFTLTLEYQSASVLGHEIEFTKPPTLALDLSLDPKVSGDDLNREYGYTQTISDRILMQSQPSFSRRLQSFFNNYITRLVYFNGGRKNNTLRLPLSRPNEVVQLMINGQKVVSGKGVYHDGLKSAFLDQFSGDSCVGHFSSYADGIVNQDGLYNPNLGLTYNRATPQQSACFSFGVIELDRMVQNDLILEYSSDLSQGSNGVIDGDTIYIAAQVLRSYSPQTKTVRFVSA